MNDIVKFHYVGTPIKGWKFFDNFFLWPALYVGSINTYSYGEKYMFTRMISIYFLWFEIGVDIKYGDVDKLKV